MRWWRARSRTDRLDLYIQLSLYGNLLFVPVFAAGSVGTDVSPTARSVLTGSVAAGHLLVCVLLLRAGIGHYLGRRARPTGLMLAGAASAVGAAGIAVAAYPDPALGRVDGPAVAVLLLVVTAYAVALASVVRPVVVVLVVGSVGCAAAFALSTALDSPRPAASALGLASLLLVVAPACRVSLWTLGMVRELDRARHVQASLAVAEERLRFARDLHDVVGRTLSVVALKAELSAQLARRGRVEAVDEMLEVRRIAQDSLAELRAVVGGYRSADLGTELAGARALLGSAGIACRVVGDGADLPAQVQGTLGWVVREGTTNVLRHSDARGCTITLYHADSGTVRLTMDNDGVPATGQIRLGNGLAGLSERLAALGGAVTAEREQPDRFSLTAELPAPNRRRIP